MTLPRQRRQAPPIPGPTPIPPNVIRQDMTTPPPRRIKEKPKPPANPYDDIATSVWNGSSFQYLPDYKDFNRTVSIPEYHYLYMKYEIDLARWERDEALEAIGDINNSWQSNRNKQIEDKTKEITDKYEMQLNARDTIISNYKKELDQKKQLECFHENDIAVDPEYWRKIKNQLHTYKDMTKFFIGTSIVMLIILLRMFLLV